ncbi:MAG: YebC/PmpR family DNA-binding transcriptional regulator [bacterium]|nr:YebC/PmpR family DNA-binding transcriptional regulator [bacterium]
MSGHSKWSTIKHKKAVTDVKRGKLFSKLGKAITVAAREKGGDPEMNPTLRTAIQKAKEVSMPQENIDRAVSRGAGGDGDTILQECVYEAYGPGGVALIITGITDNNNRTSNELKHLLSQNNSKLASPGSVLWAFEKKDGEWFPQEYSLVALSKSDNDSLLKLMNTIDDHDDVQDIYTNNKEE